MSNVLVSIPIEENSFQSLVDTASNILKAGRLDEAQQACHDLTETHPDQPNSWFLYGTTVLEAGDARTAIPALERAVSMHRVNTTYKRMLARAYRTADRNDDAAAALEQALRIEPDHPEALLTLGLIRVAQGARDVGVPLCRKGISLGLQAKWRHGCVNVLGRLASIATNIRHLGSKPEMRAAGTALARGRLWEQLGDTSTALAHYQRAAELDPYHLPALAAAGHLLVAQENFTTAFPFLERAAALAPENSVVQIDFAIALTGTMRCNEAIEVLQNVFARCGESPHALLALGRAQTGAGDAKSAQKAFKRALTLAPNSADAHFAFGRNRMEEGEIEIANRLFFDTLAIDPAHASAYRFLAGNKALAADDATFNQMLELLQSGRLSLTKQSRLHFAAAAVFEQAGDVENAFVHFTAANDLKNVIFDPDYCAAYFGKLIETYDKDFFDRIRGWGNPDERPLFIVGMPRSGTSLIEQILASHGDVFGAGELEMFNGFVAGLAERVNSDAAYPECVAALERDAVADMALTHLGTLEALALSARFVSDKMPTNFLHIGLILTLFPNARIIHCRRDPRDTCFSIFGLGFAGDHSYAYDQRNLGRFYRQYERLMDHWHHTVPGTILDVQYEDVIADQEAQTRRLLEFCGLEWDARCLDFHKTDRTVRTWSYNQVRQPIYKSSVARWRKFEAHLTPLLDELDVRDAERAEI